MYRHAVIEAVKQDLVIQKSDLPSPAAGEVLIALEAAALNRRDYWITQGLYPGLQLPCVPGSDGAGCVVACGAGVQDFALGDEVIVNPGNNWGDDEGAQSAEFTVLGMPAAGTHASHLIIAADRVHKKPAHLDWQSAAALPLAYATAYRALMVQGQCQAGQRVLISGIGGGVAIAALQMAVAIGAEVIVTSSSADKSAKAKELGAVAAFNYREDDWAKQVLKQHGMIDVFIDGSGGDNVNAALLACRPGAHVVMYGATAGAPEKLDVFKLFWKQIHLVAAAWPAMQTLRRCWNLCLITELFRSSIR